MINRLKRWHRKLDDIYILGTWATQMLWFGVVPFFILVGCAAIYLGVLVTQPLGFERSSTIILPFDGSYEKVSEIGVFEIRVEKERFAQLARGKTIYVVLKEDNNLTGVMATFFTKSGDVTYLYRDHYPAGFNVRHISDVQQSSVVLKGFEKNNGIQFQLGLIYLASGASTLILLFFWLGRIRYIVNRWGSKPSLA